MSTVAYLKRKGWFTSPVSGSLDTILKFEQDAALAIKTLKCPDPQFHHICDFFFVLCEKTLTQSRSVRLQALPDRDCQSRRDDETEFLPVARKKRWFTPPGDLIALVYSYRYSQSLQAHLLKGKNIYTSRPILLFIKENNISASILT